MWVLGGPPGNCPPLPTLMTVDMMRTYFIWGRMNRERGREKDKPMLVKIWGYGQSCDVMFTPSKLKFSRIIKLKRHRFFQIEINFGTE